MHYHCPPSLKVGDTIGLVSPSSPMQKGRLDLGIRYLETAGFRVKTGLHVHDTCRFLAGNDADRARDIMAFFADPTVHAIMAINAGYGSQRILPFLDAACLRAHPKWLTGFSDTTALQSGLLRTSGVMSCTGFTFRDLTHPPVDTLLEKTLWACLSGEAYTVNEGISLISGKAQGPLLGGNLSCLTALTGTPWQPDFTGCILLIEDVWSEPYRIDSMLSQLELAGCLQQVNGLVWGEFEQCHALHAPDRDGTVDDIIEEWSARIGVPCIKAFPYGHRTRRCVLPLGKHVHLDADTCMLSLPASPD